VNETTQAAVHLGTLFPVDLWRPGEYIEIRCLDASQSPSHKGPRGFFDNHTEALSFALANRDQWDVFFGVGWRRCPKSGDMRSCRCAKRGADHVSRLTAAYVDLDIGKAGESVDAIVARLRDGPPPSLAVSSGRGLHAYWMLDEPTEDLERVRRLNQRLRDILGGDNAVDPARILRVAGTLHHKQRPAQPVSLLKLGEAVAA
jgi:hypothetical protein